MERLADLLHGIPATTTMAIADENSDKLLDLREYSSWLVDRMIAEHEHKSEWKKSDADEDGEMSFGEYLSSPMGEYAMHAPTGCPADFNAGPADTMCKARPRSGIKTAKLRFQSMDRDGDGSVSEKEFSVHASPDSFLSADRNHDGAIERDEYMKAPTHWRSYTHRDDEDIESEYKRMDRDSDGKITRQEFEDDLREARLRTSANSAGMEVEGSEDAQDQANEERWISITDPIIAPKEDFEPKVPLKHFINDEAPSRESVTDLEGHQNVFKLPEDMSAESVPMDQGFGSHTHSASSERAQTGKIHEIEADVMPLSQ